MSCRWCGKDRRAWSDWEQQSLFTDSWWPLCNPCARKRLDNPYSGVLPMRRVKAAS